MLSRELSSFDTWRDTARPLLAARVAPGEIEWVNAGTVLPSQATAPPAATAHRINPRLLQLLQALSMYRAVGRWELMYRLTWRSVYGRADLLEDAADPDVRHASLMERAVKRDAHKMHAFVRFRETRGDGDMAAYFSWFEPQHEILRLGAGFFVRRFPNHDWTIATPDGAAVWKARSLRFVAPPDPDERPRGDDCEGLWRTYYRSICNVARVNPLAMQREMPRRYWRYLPESVEIDPLLREGAAGFARRQHESPAPRRPLPIAVKRALPEPLAGAEGPQSCRRCDLWRHATQPVTGEGAADALLMLVGEEPGDEEDLHGRPFVGPAGTVLAAAIAAAGLDRRQVFVTNAVKHFKWEPRGKRRLHKRPGTTEIEACSVWLEREIAAVQPLVIVALGATALRALTALPLSVEDARRRELRHAGGARIVATYHPAAVLRAAAGRADALRTLLEADLRAASATATVVPAPASSTS